jgi:hypothetical protein
MEPSSSWFAIHNLIDRVLAMMVGTISPKGEL